MIGRSRRRRSGGTRRWAVCLLAVAGFLAATTVLPAASFDTGEVGRESGLDVADDDGAVQSLDTVTSVRVGETDPLTNVTNNFGRSVTVTVSLRDDATHLGDLVVDGVVVGNRTSFTLDAGATERVSLAVPDDGSLSGEVVHFHVEASATGLSVRTQDRSVTIE